MSREGREAAKANQERLQRLIKQGEVSTNVLASLDGRSLGEFTTPDDILQALKANRHAWENFQRYSDSYQRIRLAYIDSGRRRPGEFQKRLTHFLDMTEKEAIRRF